VRIFYTAGLSSPNTIDADFTRTAGGKGLGSGA
jgi:hypothetical protein